MRVFTEEKSFSLLLRSSTSDEGCSGLVGGSESGAVRFSGEEV